MEDHTLQSHSVVPASATVTDAAEANQVIASFHATPAATHLQMAAGALTNLSLSGTEALDYLRTSRHIYGLCERIQEAERTIGRERTRQTLEEVRKLHRQSPFFVRTQDWPRGYPGDFETIEYVVQGQNQAPEQTVGYYLESIILKSAIVQQHRNKVRAQADLILQKVQNAPEARILSIGCGSSADLQLIEQSLQTHSVHLTLLDQDAGALACSQQKLARLKDKIQLVQGNVIRLAYRLDTTFDLIVIGGVFDYLQDKHIVSLLKKLYSENLRPGGEIFFTNIAEGNPYRPWMEYCFDWFLIERTQTGLADLCEQAQMTNGQVTIRPEETGLTYLVHIVKKEGNLS